MAKQKSVIYQIKISGIQKLLLADRYVDVEQWINNLIKENTDAISRRTVRDRINEVLNNPEENTLDVTDEDAILLSVFKAKDYKNMAKRAAGWNSANRVQLMQTGGQNGQERRGEGRRSSDNSCQVGSSN